MGRWPAPEAGRSGPLVGYRIIEFAGIGPGPFCTQVLGDLGVDVVAIERLEAGEVMPDRSIDRRSKRSIAIDLKDPRGARIAMQLIGAADALIEGFRPGAMERLGLGPEPCLTRNPKLIYARMTGWGQTGPLANTAGHDINYIGLTGALLATGQSDRPPPPPLNLVGDFGAGAMLLAVGILAALLEAGKSGRGQVVDAAIVDGTALLMGFIRTLDHAGRWSPERSANMLDGGAPFYRCYETSDHGYVSVGAIEAKFFDRLLETLEIDRETFGGQWERRSWPAQHDLLAACFARRTRAEWGEKFAGVDACVAPVLDYRETVAHPHSRARDAYLDLDAMIQPAPAPRFSRTPPGPPEPSHPRGADCREILSELGFDESDIDGLIAAGVVVAP